MGNFKQKALGILEEIFFTRGASTVEEARRLLETELKTRAQEDEKTRMVIESILSDTTLIENFFNQFADPHGISDSITSIKSLT